MCCQVICVITFSSIFQVMQWSTATGCAHIGQCSSSKSSTNLNSQRIPALQAAHGQRNTHHIHNGREGACKSYFFYANVNIPITTSVIYYVTLFGKNFFQISLDKNTNILEKSPISCNIMTSYIDGPLKNIWSERRCESMYSKNTNMRGLRERLLKQR